MKNIMKKYITLLHLELDDLTADIEFQIEQCRLKKENGKLTNYIFLENQAVYKNELHAVQTFHTIIDKIDVEKFVDIDGLVRELSLKFYDAVEEYGYAKAAAIFAERKMQKVAKYVLS